VSNQLSSPLIRIDSLVKSYGGLRPLRLRQFTLEQGDRIGLAGFDRTSAEVFVNLITGATLPEEGTVSVFGRATGEIADSTDWLATVDRFGIVSERIVLLDQLTAAQNIAMSLTLDIDPLPDDVRGPTEALGREVGLTLEALGAPVADATPAVRQRVRLARAIAADPTVLLIEHPIASLGPDQVGPFAADLARVSAARGLGVIVLAAEAEHARPFVSCVLVLNGGTGELTEAKRPGLLSRLMKK
jgi:ABC-type transporter Mla maintaining outer membrane lipid asymmetry ATPase subunit MlaF